MKITLLESVKVLRYSKELYLKHQMYTRSIVKSSHPTQDALAVNFEKHAVRIYVRYTTCLCVCSKLQASKSSHLRCALFTISQVNLIFVLVVSFSLITLLGATL